LIYPLNRSNKNEKFLEKKIKLVFVWPIRGVNQNKNILQGGKSKKSILHGGKPEMAYITGGKDLLTLKINTINNNNHTRGYINVLQSMIHNKL